MFWISSAVIVMSTLFIKLGALLVITGVLAMALKASLGVILALAGLLIWCWYRKKRTTWKNL